MKRGKWTLLLAGALLAWQASGGVARAEMSEITLAQQYGLAFLPLMVMEHQQLLEKHLRAEGLGDVKVRWIKVASGAMMNDALLGGHLSFASGGVPPFITIWAKTKGSINVKGVCAMVSMPLYLNTRNPRIRSVKDFTDKDKIALPAVKVSNQAMFLQMAAEKAFGEGHAHELDPLTVSLSHPDAMTAMLSGGEITTHFSAPPFEYEELEKAGVHRILNSYDLLGGPHTFAMVWTTAKFRKENPRTYAAFLAAYKEANDLIARDKNVAAEVYLADTKDPDSAANIVKMIEAPGSEYTMTPQNILKQAQFMYHIGTIKVKPASWKELFFPEVHPLAGS